MKIWIHWKISQSYGDSIIEEPPLAIKEGGIIKEGFNEDVDKLRNARPMEKNGLPNLKNGNVKRQESKLEDQV